MKIWILVWVLPVLFGLAAWWICKELQASERVVEERRRAEAEARLARLQHAQRPSSERGALKP